MRKRAVFAVMAAIALISMAVVSTAGAARPSFNPVCLGTKIEGGTSGVFAMNYGGEAGSISIVVEQTAQGEVFSFDTGNADHLVTGVDAKGGTSLNTYAFGGGVATASGLHASLNPHSGKWYGISHLCFHTASGGEEEEGGGWLE